MLTFADWMRVVAVVLTAICMGGFFEPISARSAHEAWRVWLLLFSLEGFMFSCAMAAVAHFGESSVAWYRTPCVIVFAAVGVVYLAIYRRDVRRGQDLAQEVHESRRRSREERDGVRIRGQR